MPDASNHTEANRQTIRTAFDAWRDGTGGITDLFAPEMVWRIEGHSFASKEHGSKQRHQRGPDAFRRSIQHLRSVPPGHHPIGLRRRRQRDGRGVASDGQPYENSYVWVVKMHDGKVIDGTAFYDSISFNDLWTRVQPR